MRISLTALFTIVAIFMACSVSAQMSSTNYEIRWDSVGYGGSETSSSASYQLRDTVGSIGAGRGAGTSYLMDAGYRSGIFDRIVTFEIFGQSTTNTSASVLSGTTITVASASSFSTGDKVALIQDRGTSQVSGVGEIIDIAANDITLDSLDSGGAVISIDGSGDYLYLLGASSVSFGGVSETDVAQKIVGWEVSIDVDNGYSVSVIEDTDLASGANDIDDVADGSVTAGSEEYGARSSDQSLASSTFDTQDTGITSAFQQVGSRSSTSFASRDFITLKAATSTSSVSGTYSHNLSLIVSGAY
jgi:hypothetical protein